MIGAGSDRAKCRLVAHVRERIAPVGVQSLAGRLAFSENGGLEAQQNNHSHAGPAFERSHLNPAKCTAVSHAPTALSGDPHKCEIHSTSLTIRASSRIRIDRFDRSRFAALSVLLGCPISADWMIWTPPQCLPPRRGHIGLPLTNYPLVMNTSAPFYGKEIPMSTKLR